MDRLLSIDQIGPSLLAVIAAWPIYCLAQALYNVPPFHPLNVIPGPKLAAATYLVEFWYDVICFGRYTTEIRKMHGIYGPIVRINPNEVHCSDPDFIDEIYTVVVRKRNKPLHQFRASVVMQAAFGTVENDLHRVRRAPVAKLFSRPTISQLESKVAALAQVLCDKILTRRGQPVPLDLSIAYSNMTTDVIWEYCFGETFGLLQQPGFDVNFREPTRSAVQTMFIFRFFPFLKKLRRVLVWWVPISFLEVQMPIMETLFLTFYRFVNYLSKSTALLIKTMEIDLPRSIQKNVDDRRAGISYERPTIVGAFFESEPNTTVKRIVDESFTITGAGTETTSWALAVATFYLLTKPHVLTRLTEELKGVVDDPRKLPSWTTLEKLPYLDGVIQESLRLSYGVSLRTARIPIGEDLVYKGYWNKQPVRYTIPRGYAIGMSTAITNHNEQLFPDSHNFLPERWLDAERRKELDHGHLAFGKGSRACLGMNLALCELYLALTAMSLRVFPHMRLYETSEEDVRYDHDMLIPMTKAESKGIRAILV